MSFFLNDVFISSVPINCTGEKIAFVNENKKGGTFQIGNLQIKEILEVSGTIIKKLKKEDFTQGKILEDYKFKTIEEKGMPIINESSVSLTYDFTDDKDFRGTFLRIPVSVEKADKICLMLDGDVSKNRFFIIVHDKSGEQHLIQSMPLIWSGTRVIKVDLKRFFQAPPERVIEATHWNGDKNQKIDFPITALDIGVCKREKALKQSGRIGISNLRFEE